MATSKTIDSSALWRRLPILWSVLFCAVLALNTFGLSVSHPEQVYGWRMVGLLVLVVGLMIGYQLLSFGRIYRHERMNLPSTLGCVGLQLALFGLLSWQYDPSFAWFSLALLYQSVGALPRRHWPLPLLGVFLLLVVGTSPLAATGTLDPWPLISGAFLFASNLGIAVFLGMLHEQRDQLHAALEQLRIAHAALAAKAAESQELAVLRERTRLARAMHDDIGHALVVVNVKLEAAQLLYARDQARGDAELEATRAIIRTTMTSLRRALADLRAPASAYADLPDALRGLAHDLQSRSAISVTCWLDSAPPAPPADVREALWYVAREALINIERHAAATSATVTLHSAAGGWQLQVSDNGAGMPMPSAPEAAHYGLLGMRERLALIGGTLSIHNSPRGGSVVEAYVPAQPNQAAYQAAEIKASAQ